MEMSVIVAIGHAILTHVLEVVPAVGPGIRIQGLGTGEVVHAAGRRSLATPFPRSMVVPVVVESIYVLAVHLPQSGTGTEVSPDPRQGNASPD